MYCDKCGTKLNDGAVFCFNCGEKLQRQLKEVVTTPDNEITVVSVKEKDDFDRNVVIDYLKNILTLYCMIQDCNDEKKTKDKKIEEYKPFEEFNLKMIKKREEQQKMLEKNKLLTKIIEVVFMAVFLFFTWPFLALMWLWDRIIWNPITRFWYKKAKPGLVLIKDFLLYGPKKMQKVRKEREEKEARKNKELEDYVYKRDNAVAVIESIEKEKCLIDERIKEIHKYIEKFYSVNILPAPYRSAGAVDFLYSYMTTSNESFESAMYHCDLDEIKKKIDIVINQQRISLVNQAMQISQNKSLIEQNNAKLRTLGNIMRGTWVGDSYNKLSDCYIDYYSWLVSD